MAFGHTGSRSGATRFIALNKFNFENRRVAMTDRRRIADDQLFAHFVTFSVDGRRRLLDHDQPKRLVLAEFCETLKQFDARCIGFVIMPNHVHSLIWLPECGKLSQFMHAWKRRSSFNLRNWYRNGSANYLEDVEERNRFWLPKYHSFEIHSRHKLEEKLVYMHENPVRAGLVSAAIDWAWSSARWYADRTSVGVPIQWVE